MGSGRVIWDLWLVSYSSQTYKIQILRSGIQGPANLVLTSLASSPDTSPFIHHLPAILHTRISWNILYCSCPSAFPLVLPPSGVHFFHLSVNSFLTSSRKKINCCLLIVLCSSCNYHATLNHCMSFCFTWLWNSKDRTWLYFISCWPSTWHLVVLDKCSMNEWLYKWGEKKGFQCVKKYSKPCWSWNGCRLGSSYLKKWFYYIIFWISGNHSSKEMGEIALEVNIFWGIHKEDFMF